MEKEIQNYEEFVNTINGESGVIIVDFYADWCGPCRMLGPVLSEIAKEHPEITVLRVNVDRVSQAAAAFNVSSIPNLFKIESGKVVASHLGYAPKNSIVAKFGL